MDQWTVEYVDQMTRDVLSWSFIQRRRTPFEPSKKPGFDWDRVTGMVVRAWVYAREHPSWMQEVTFEETTERFAQLLGFAIQKTTVSGFSDTNPGFTMEKVASIHADKQIDEHELVEDFVNWALQEVNA